MATPHKFDIARPRSLTGCPAVGRMRPQPGTAPEFSAPEFGIELNAPEFGAAELPSLELPIPELPELMDLPDPPYELDLQWLPESPEEIDLYCYETLDNEIFEPIPGASTIFKTPIAAMKVSGPMFDSVYALRPIPCQR